MAKNRQQQEQQGAFSGNSKKEDKKTWRRYEFRLDGKKNKYHYGNYPGITLSNARKFHTVTECH